MRVFFSPEISCAANFSTSSHIRLHLFQILLHINFQRERVTVCECEHDVCILCVVCHSVLLNAIEIEKHPFLQLLSLFWYCWTIFNVDFQHIFHYGKLMFVREFPKYFSACKTSSCDISPKEQDEAKRSKTKQNEKRPRGKNKYREKRWRKINRKMSKPFRNAHRIQIPSGNMLKASSEIIPPRDCNYHCDCYGC